MRTLRYLIIAISLLCRPACAQDCGKGALDRRVKHALATFLSDLPASGEVSVEQIRNVRLPIRQFPQADLKEMKITSDSIAIQVYNPGKRKDLPILIYYHPGGFVTPMLAFMQYECWRQAKLFNAIVVAVDYRVAPEYPFPAAVNDCYGAFRWIAENGRKLGGDTSRDHRRGP
jgi:acetyl esterase